MGNTPGATLLSRVICGALAVKPGDLLPASIRFLRARTRRQRLAIVAWEMEHHEDVHVCLVSRKLADELRVWTGPVQFMIEPRHDGLIDLVCRKFGSDGA